MQQDWQLKKGMSPVPLWPVSTFVYSAIWIIFTAQEADYVTISTFFLVISPTWRRVPPPDFSDRMPIHIISLRFYYLYLWINRSSHWILAPDDLLHCCGEVPKTSIV